MFRADLHCHTTMSDGTFTPKELLTLAKEIGLQGISITDHDSVDAYETAFETASALNIRLGVGAEFSCVHKAINVHILAYDFERTHPKILNLCHRHRMRRIERNEKILEKLSRYGISIFKEELLQFESRGIGRPHIAQLMVSKGYVKSIQEAFQRYLADNKPCYCSGQMISAEETIEIIHEAGGKAFIAHPHLIKKMGMIKMLLTLNFDGIECYYGRFNLDQNKRWVQIANDRKLLKSGGSDFHGTVKDFISLGCSWVDEETFNQIFQKMP